MPLSRQLSVPLNVQSQQLMEQPPQAPLHSPIASVNNHVSHTVGSVVSDTGWIASGRDKGFCPLLSRAANHGWRSSSGVPFYKWVFDKFNTADGPHQQECMDLPAVHIFYGCSGPACKVDGFAAWASLVGYVLGFRVLVTEADILNSIDLADDTTWNAHARDLGANGKYSGSIFSPPCETYSRARSDTDGGPRILRGPLMPDLLGLPDLTIKEKEQVRLGTLLAIRTAHGIRCQNDGGRPWLLENPPEEEGHPSLFRLPEVSQVIAPPRGHKAVFPQCPFGSLSVKLSEFRSSFQLTDIPASKCPHQRRWWRLPPSGRWIRAQHPILKGKFCAMEPAAWEATSVEDRSRPAKAYLTKAAAAYPSMLNCYLACQLVPWACHAFAMSKLVRVGKWGNALVSASSTPSVGIPTWSLPLGNRGAASAVGINESVPLLEEMASLRRKPIMDTPLRLQASDERARQDRAAIGGMRRPHRSVARLPSVQKFGSVLRQELDGYLQESKELEQSILGGKSRADFCRSG